MHICTSPVPDPASVHGRGYPRVSASCHDGSRPLLPPYVPVDAGHAVVGAAELCVDNPNTERYRQEVAAVMPVKNDHVKIVLKLISLGAEVNMPDFTGETPLHLCAIAQVPIDGSIKIAKALLRAGADANQQDRFGRTPLLAATICQKFSLLALLLQHGADPFIAANNGVSPFSVSSSRPRALQIFSKFSKAACKEARAGQKEAAGENLHRCAAADCEENATKKCRGCFSVWYCSSGCQHGDWRGNHEAVCKVRKVVKSSSIMNVNVSVYLVEN